MVLVVSLLRRSARHFARHFATAAPKPTPAASTASAASDSSSSTTNTTPKKESSPSTTSSSEASSSTSEAAAPRLHSQDIAFKPTDDGWGYNPKYSSNWDNIFSLPPPVNANSAPPAAAASVSEGDDVGIPDELLAAALALTDEQRRALADILTQTQGEEDAA